MTQQNPTPDEQSTLRETCVLVEFHGGVFNWKKPDKTASATLSKQTNNPNSFQAHKNIFAGCDGVLSSTKALVNEARAFHYSLTLPAPKSWGDAAFISNALVPTYRKTMTEFEIKLDGLKQHLRNEWDSMLQQAQAALGSSHNPSDYDDVESVVDQCYIKIDFRPVPSAQDIANHPTLQFIKDAMEKQTVEGNKEAVHQLWGKLFESVRAAKENLNKLSKEDGRFRVEWAENLRTLLPAFRQLNVWNDPHFDKLADEASQLLRLDVSVLKEDLSERAALAKEANKLFDKLSAVYVSKG